MELVDSDQLNPPAFGQDDKLEEEEEPETFFRF